MSNKAICHNNKKRNTRKNYISELIDYYNN